MLNLKFFIVPMNLNYGSIFYFQNKLKFDHSNICTNRLIMEQKVNNTSPSHTLISLSPLLRVLVFFVVLKYDQMLQIF